MMRQILAAASVLMAAACGPWHGRASAAALAPPGAADVGINLEVNADYSAGAAWVDARNMFRRWGLPNEPWKVNPSLRLTPDGYPLADASSLAFLKDYPDGAYKLSYEGSGTVVFGGIGRLAGGVTRRGPLNVGEVALKHNGKGGPLLLHLTRVNPKDPVRNLKLIAPGYKPDTTQVFTDEFLRRLRPFSIIRFMDWGRTNNSEVREWADRTKGGSFLNAGPNGVAVEDMVALVNALKKDMWINVPDQSSDDYARQLARLLRDSLHPKANVYVEFSNEVWNGSFKQYHRTAAAAKADTMITETNVFASIGEETAARLARIAAIFKEEFGSQAGRVRPVLCGQCMNPFFLERGLAFLKAKVGDPKTLLYAISVAPYVQLDAKVETPDMSMDQLFDAMRHELETRVTDGVRKHAALAKRHGLKLIAYEGGQHLIELTASPRPASTRS